MKALTILGLVAVATSNQIKFYNNCRYKVWPGILGNSGKEHPEGGGFALDARQTKIVTVANDWAGKIWPRTHCDSSGHCQTGDCGNKIQCNGSVGAQPISTLEFTLAGGLGLDFYDINLVEGFNVPVKIEPTDGFHKRNGDRRSCTPVGCRSDLNSNPFLSNFRYRSLCLNTICPKQLAVKFGRSTIGCMSACNKFKTDLYCCRGNHSNPSTCNSSKWPINYPGIFERACPTAYSYPFHDRQNTYSCRGDPIVNYRIIFCP
ncbi:hypothetical protein GE061_015470 [Apolygus lucorum]|uniref:Thaumatin-like protein n=1 Tax=Apolygus lucorum TaxID=248454 RepID=A0A8S9XN52_APOLU|nr:hypothetical protein GE061_015470 [Apolygus lucorum]